MSPYSFSDRGIKSGIGYGNRVSGMRARGSNLCVFTLYKYLW
jgi:hypothetical protein